MYRESYFDINNIFGSATNFRLRHAPAKLEKLTFCSDYLLYFGTAILKFDSFSIVPYCTYMNCKDDSLFLSFSTIRIIMYQTSILPYTLFPTYLPQAYSRWSIPDWQTDRILHPLFSKSLNLNNFGGRIWGRIREVGFLSFICNPTVRLTSTGNLVSGNQ